MATAKKLTQAAKIRTHAAAYPNRSIKEIAEKLGIRYQAVYQVLKVKPDVKTPKKDWKTVMLATSKKAMPFKEEAERIYELTKGRQRMHPVTGKMLMEGPVTMHEPQADNVNHPAHYKTGGIETIDFIEAKGLSYHLGNVVKYIARADSKGNREEDLLKARWYLNREIAKLTKEQA
jgi:signal recognition particle subunit SEC65